jgi:hypothetical protein
VEAQLFFHTLNVTADLAGTTQSARSWPKQASQGEPQQIRRNSCALYILISKFFERRILQRISL